MELALFINYESENAQPAEISMTTTSLQTCWISHVVTHVCETVALRPINVSQQMDRLRVYKPLEADVLRDKKKWD